MVGFARLNSRSNTGETLTAPVRNHSIPTKILVAKND